MFKPTHMFMFGEGSPSNKLMFPKGVSVAASSQEDDEEILWVSDSQGNYAGWAKKDGAKNYAGSFVVKI